MLTSYDFSFWDWGNSIYFSKATNNIIKILNLKLDSSQTKPVHLQLAVTSRRSLGSFLTQDWEPVTITLQALELIDKAEPVQVHFTLNLRDQQSMSMQDGCRVYMATRGLCFMVSWTIFKNHLLKAGLTQNMETMAFQTLTTIDFILFSQVWGHTWREFYWLAFGWWPITYAFALHLRVRNHTTWWFRRCVLGRPSDTFFRALTISWSWLLTHVWSDPRAHMSRGTNFHGWRVPLLPPKSTQLRSSELWSGRRGS